jgi:hypothetical protein
MSTVNVFANQGVPVSLDRRQRAMKELDDMVPEFDLDMKIYLVNRACDLIEKDMLFAIIEDVSTLDEGLSRLDLTGRYRLAAALLA